MNIETIDRDDHQKTVIAEFDTDTFERFKRQAARKIASETRIPGFRPGKAPYDVVRRLYGDKAIMDEAVNLMLEDVYPQVIREAKIDPYGPGILEEILSIDPPKFSFVIPLNPTVSLGDYKEIRLEYNEPVVGEDKVNGVIERLRRRGGTAVPVDRPAVTGDLVAIKLSARLTKPAEGEDATLIEENDYELIAGAPEDHTDEFGNEWPYPGFVNELVGLSTGEKKAVFYTFAEDSSSDDLNGKEAEFSFEVVSVKEIHKPELNDEFAQSLGPYENLDALRGDILKQLQQTETRNYNNAYIDELIAKLVDGSTVVYPPVLLTDEINHLLVHFEEDLAKQKMDLDTYLKTRELTRDQLVENEIKPSAERRVKRQLVLQEFAVQENIQLQPEEMQVVYDMAMTQARNDKNLQSVRHDRKMNTQELADTLARGTINEIFNQRLINRLRDIATGKADAVEETTDASEVVATEVDSPDVETTKEPLTTATDEPADLPADV